MNRDIVSTRLVGDNPQKVQGTDMLWVDGEYLSVTPLRFREPARSMIALSHHESFENCCHRTEYRRPSKDEPNVKASSTGQAQPAVAN